MKATVESLELAKDLIPKLIRKFQQKNAKLSYQDIRLEIFEGKSSSALQGNAKGATEDYGIAIGVRSLAKAGRLNASGFSGKSIGLQQLGKIAGLVQEMQEISFKRALSNSRNKEKLKNRYPLLGKSVHSTEFAPIEVCKDYVKAEFKKSPRDISLEELIKRVEDCSKELQKINGIASNCIGGVSGLERKLFASSEGSLLDQNRAITEAFVFVAAKGKASETYSETLGRYAGLEVFDGRNVFGKTLEEFANYIASGTVDVANAPAMKRTEKEATVITDPWYNALLSHEITGHPSEADRALKREAAWAGRAWWFRGMEDNEFGKQVASELVTVFSDPTLEDGYGYYKYDDEGVKAKKVLNIKNGYLNEFLNSRETALILGKTPNGGMRATSADLVPIIRMNNTCFAAGDWKMEELFEETKDGYYALGQKTPSIGETRQNFKISCWKLYKIEKGELKQLYRMAGLTADSYSFLKSIDAVASDFKLYNIPNCGKGTPMQVMKVGNGGPHIRAKAIVSGSHIIGSGFK